MTDQGKKYLSDIILAIDLIESFTSAISNFENYTDDLKTQSAVERQLGIIGEAINKFEKLYPEKQLDDSRKIVGLRNQFISKMSCSLKGTKDTVILLKDSFVYRIYDSEEIEGNYFCSYGLNADYKFVFEQSEFLVSGFDSKNAIRILELKDHPFFISTVFVPQVDSSIDNPNKLITEFVRAVNN